MPYANDSIKALMKGEWADQQDGGSGGQMEQMKAK